MMSDGIRAHAKAGQFVLTDEIDIDDANASGRWIKTDTPVQVRQ